MITTSEIKISVLVKRDAAVQALRLAHRAFELDRAPDGGPDPAPFTPRRLASPARGQVSPEGLDAPLAPGMEDLVISDVELDTTQSRVTVLNLPDRPGEASRVFDYVADAGVFVDMIVQSAGRGGTTHLSLTVPRAEAQRAAQAARLAVPEGQVVVDPELAKLSVTGVGMRTHTGVAAAMFGALAQEGINIELISTSEVRLNVVTHERTGDSGIGCLRRAFRLPEA
jgi:aspartate kinase